MNTEVSLWLSLAFPRCLTSSACRIRVCSFVMSVFKCLPILNWVLIFFELYFLHVGVDSSCISLHLPVCRGFPTVGWQLHPAVAFWCVLQGGLKSALPGPRTPSWAHPALESLWSVASWAWGRAVPSGKRNVFTRGREEQSRNDSLPISQVRGLGMLLNNFAP